MSSIAFLGIIAGGLMITTIFLLVYALQMRKALHHQKSLETKKNLFLEAILKSAVDSIYLKDTDHRVIMTNEFFYRNINKTEDEIIGLTDFELFGEELGKSTQIEEDKIIQTGKPLISAVEESGFETRDRHYVLTTKVPVYEGEKVVGIFGITREFTAIARLQEELEYSATHDSLTGLSNRTAITYALHEVLKGKKPVAVLFIDLDNFKRFNDEYSHDFGDEVLKLVARRLESVFRKDDLVGRLSGDEFLVILRSINTKAEAEIATQKLIEQFNFPLMALGHSVVCKLSIGIACTDACPVSENLSVEDLIHCADHAMYQVKKNGKGGYQFFEDVCGKS